MKSEQSARIENPVERGEARKEKKLWEKVGCSEDGLVDLRGRKAPEGSLYA